MAMHARTIACTAAARPIRSGALGEATRSLSKWKLASPVLGGGSFTTVVHFSRSRSFVRVLSNPSQQGLAGFRKAMSNSGVARPPHKIERHHTRGCSGGLAAINEIVDASIGIGKATSLRGGCGDDSGQWPNLSCCLRCDSRVRCYLCSSYSPTDVCSRVCRVIPYGGLHCELCTLCEALSVGWHVSSGSHLFGNFPTQL